MTKRDNKNISEKNDDRKSTGTDVGAGGEDDSSTEIEGNDSHLHDDQKSRRLSPSVDTSNADD